MLLVFIPQILSGYAFKQELRSWIEQVTRISQVGADCPADDAEFSVIPTNASRTHVQFLGWLLVTNAP
ncbi:MAG: hypothetical protein JOZ78_18395 [Chroococcidiopsidaceae cyanobacterium CP_BM_ER_R8_30]|nr:hypothetical protein [Chroococcidiopsidaceae cyanobacterium CP_BM_ER_R8_30]